VALAVYVSRQLSTAAASSSSGMSFDDERQHTLYLEPLDQLNASTVNKRRHRKDKNSSGSRSATMAPFSFERTDVWCDNNRDDETTLHVFLRTFLCSSSYSQDSRS